MKRNIFVLTFIIIFYSTEALSQDYPKRRAGLWQIDMKMEGIPGGFPIPKSFNCIDEKSDAKMMQMSQNVDSSQCSKNEMKKDGSNYIHKMICKTPMGSIDSTAVLSGDFNSSYTITSTVKHDPPMMGMAETKTVINSTHVGPCKPGQKPGDIIMDNGITMNVFDMPGAKP